MSGDMIENTKRVTQRLIEFARDSFASVHLTLAMFDTKVQVTSAIEKLKQSEVQ